MAEYVRVGGQSLETKVSSVESGNLKSGKTSEKLVGRSSSSLRQSSDHLIKGNRKKFNRLFREKVQISDIILLPNGNYGIFEGHVQGRRNEDKTNYYIQYSLINNFDAKKYPKPIFSFPEEVILKDNTYKISYELVSGRNF